MSTTRRGLDKSTISSRSKSAAHARHVATSATTGNGKPATATIRSVGPVTRSLALLLNKSNTAASTKTTVAAPKTNGISKAPSSSLNTERPARNSSKTRQTKADARPPPAPPQPKPTTKSHQSRTFMGLNKLAARLTPSREKSKQKNVTASKDSVISDELESDIQWVAGSEYEFAKDRSSIFPNVGKDAKRDFSCSYLRVSQVLNGYGSPVRRSKTPDANEVIRIHQTITKNASYQSTKSTPKVSSAVPQSKSGSEVSDNGFCEGRTELDEFSTYSFTVPPFSEPVTDGEGYRALMDQILALFNSHLKKCEILLGNQACLPDSVAECVRVAVGRTQLLMRKRLTQFDQQLESHLKPVAGEKETTLNDLHGLWSIVEIQIDDIRACFADVESSRMCDWQVPPSPKQTLIAASSMPSLHVIQPANPPANGKENNAKTAAHKVSAGETATKEKDNLARERTLAAAKKRQDDIRKRQEFIRAKRAEMAAAAATTTNNDDASIAG